MFDRMRISKTLIFIIVSALVSVVLSSCSDNNELEILPDDSEDYCLMYYCSGGDPAHDLSFMSAIESAAIFSNPKVTLTCLFKFSGEGEGSAHNGIRRYKGENGRMTIDETFAASENFDITDSESLTQFINWSAETFPNRKYILVLVGHGHAFSIDRDLPEASSRATISDGKKRMPSYEVANGIKNSSIHFAAMLAHSCEQGSIEMLAEWEGLSDYLLGSPFSIPDIGHDYASLVTDLSNDIPLEESLKRTARRTISLWKEYHDYGYFGEVIEVTRIKDLSALWSVLRNTFDYMKSSVDEKSYCTDRPAIYGERYGNGYLRALKAMTVKKDSVFDYLHSELAIDLPDYLRNAVIYTGNIRLSSYVNQVQEEIDKILVYHEQTNGKKDFIYNMYFSDALKDETKLRRYQNCRFDRITGWSKLCKSLLEQDSEN